MRDPAAGDRVERELHQAERFRADGQAGRARVCARRAAGWALGPVYRRQTGDEPPASALTLLRWYGDSPVAPDQLRRAARRLTTRVTHEHDLPHPEDPIDDARLLIEGIEASDGSAAPS